MPEPESVWTGPGGATFDLRQVGATFGGWMGGSWRCADCKEPWPSGADEHGHTPSKCPNCGSVYMEERPPEDDIVVKVGGGLQRLQKAVRGPEPRPVPLAEDLGPAMWLRDSLGAVLDALEGTDEALRRLMAQGPVSERRWGRAQAHVHSTVSTEGDLPALLGRHCPVLHQLGRVRTILQTALDDPEVQRRNAKVAAIVAGLDEERAQLVRATVEALSEGDLAVPFDVDVVQDCVRRLDDALAAYQEAIGAVDRLAEQDEEGWGYQRAVVKYTATDLGEASPEMLALNLKAVMAALDSKLQEVRAA